MKTIDDLKEGDCKVITVCNGAQKEFHGYYDPKYECVFFCIPSNYKIIGYIQ